MSIRCKSALFAVALAFAGTSLAADEGYVTRRKIEPARIGELTAVLREEMEPGGRFSRIEPEERDRVEAALGRMALELEGKASLAELDDEARVRVYNLQEQVNAILLKRDDERVVCEYRKQIGSNRKQAFCETVGERLARREGNRDAMDRLNKRIQVCKDSATPTTPGQGASAGSLCTSG